MPNRLSDHLLEPNQWPEIVRHSKEMPLLQAVVAYSTQLDEQTLADQSTDTDLHRLFRGCAAIVTWLPPVTRRIAPHYTRTTWDLRALSALIPAGMDMGLSGSDACDGSGFVRWQANLHDHIHGNRARHPSDLEHNAALSYDAGEYGSAWTPNLALARIILAAYLLAAIQTISSRALPNAAQQTCAAPAALLTT
jgi:hypothetical protein